MYFAFSHVSSLSLFLHAVQCVVRVCCIRSFGHFLTNLQSNVLHFNPEAGIFTSISQSEQDNLDQQAKAQFRMVKDMRMNSNERQTENQTINSSVLICTRDSADLFRVFRYIGSVGDFSSRNS